MIFSINIFATLKPVLLRIYLDTVTVFLCKIVRSRCLNLDSCECGGRESVKLEIQIFSPSCAEKSVYRWGASITYSLTLLGLKSVYSDAGGGTRHDDTSDWVIRIMTGR